MMCVCLGNARPKRMYFVVFYGSTADFAWVSDSAIIPYQGVEAFTKYAQDAVDKALTKPQKQQLTERFQLKVTISRREDWEQAVREADESLKHISETRLEEIEPKVQFYTTKIGMRTSYEKVNQSFSSSVPPKGQPGRKPKASITKVEESSEPPSAPASSIDPNDRSLLAEKAFEFKSDDDSSTDESPVRKTPSVKIKLKKQTSNDGDSTPPAKRRYIRKSAAPTEGTTVFGQTANGSSVSYQPRTPAGETPLVNGTSTGRKRGRPRLNKPSVITNNEESSPTPKKSITKPQAFTNKVKMWFLF